MQWGMEENPPERKCPKCGGEMEVGFLRDRSGSNLSQPAEWMQGAPETTWLGRFKLGYRMAYITRYTVEAFRCEKCGFLEQYAVGSPKTGLL